MKYRVHKIRAFHKQEPSCQLKEYFPKSFLYMFRFHMMFEIPLTVDPNPAHVADIPYFVSFLMQPKILFCSKNGITL